MPNTVRLHRVLATIPEKVYRAFIEPDAMAKWLPPNGFTCTVHHMDPKAGDSCQGAQPIFRAGRTAGIPCREDRRSSAESPDRDRSAFRALGRVPEGQFPGSHGTSRVPC